MTAPYPLRTPPSRSRIWPLVTYPLRLGRTRAENPSGPFARLAVVHALSSAGDALVIVALAGSVFVSVSLHAARGRTALGLVCTVLPFVVVGPFVGPVIDRVRGGRRAMMAASAVGRVVACGFMAAYIHSLWLFPAAFASLVCSKTYLVAKASLVPEAVDRDEDLVEANAKLAVGSSIVTSAAAAIGAGVYKTLGSATVLHLDMVLLTVCAGFAFRLRPSRADRSVPANPPPLPDTGAGSARGGGRGVRLSRRRLAPRRGDRAATGVAAGERLRSPGRRAEARRLPPGGLTLAAVAMTAMRATAGMMTTLVVFAFRRDGAPLIWYGLVGVSSVAGNLGGAALAPAVRDRVPEERIVPASAFVIGTVAVLATQIRGVHRWPAALVLGAAVGVGASVAKLAFDSLVQRDPPDIARSRLFARFEAIFQLGWVLAALIPVLAPLSLMGGFLIVALVALGAGLAFILGWRRAREGSLPAWWPGLHHHRHPAPAPTAGATPDGGRLPLGAPPPTTIVGPVGVGPVDEVVPPSAPPPVRGEWGP